MSIFEDYLKQFHYENFPQLLDDELGDHFDDWLGNLDGEDYIKYADEALRIDRLILHKLPEHEHQSN